MNLAMSDTLKNRIAGLETLYQASLRLNASLAIQDVLDILVETTQDLVENLTSVRVFIREGDILAFGTAWWSSSQRSRTKAKSRPDELVYRAASTVQMVTRRGRNSASGASITSNALALLIDSEVIGVLAFTRNRDRELSTSTQDTLRLLADQAALAIKNARRFEEMSKQAYTDSLTGLPNRRALDMRLEDETRRSSRYRHSFTLAMFDVDGFKEINDTYGHPIGDRVLQHVIGCMREQLRETDFFARYGGDEFAIILPETDYQIATCLSSRLETVVKDCEIDLPGGDQLSVEISVGLASYPQHAISASALMIAADQALYQAKKLV